MPIPLIVPIVAAVGLGIYLYEKSQAPAAPAGPGAATPPAMPPSSLPPAWTIPVTPTVPPVSPGLPAGVPAAGSFACPPGAPNVGLDSMPEPFKTSIVNARNVAAAGIPGASATGSALLENLAQTLDKCGLTLAAADIRTSKTMGSTPAVPTTSAIPGFACPPAGTVPASSGIAALPDSLRGLVQTTINTAKTFAGPASDAALENLAGQLDGCGLTSAASEVRSAKSTAPIVYMGGGAAGGYGRRWR